MRILNYGSLNIDHVYSVDHFVRPGESLACAGYEVFPGGKGANQSAALALAGADVAHAGKIGSDGAWYRERLEKAGVDVTHVEVVDSPSGHAIIQVNSEGENAIILIGGANRETSPGDAAKVIGEFQAGDYLLLQNEISAIPEIITTAAEAGMTVVINPAPMGPEVKTYPLDKVGIFIVNEIEGTELTGETEPDAVLSAMQKAFPAAAVVLTLGSKGVLYAKGDTRIAVDAEKVEPVDTTAAGDTFIGYFLAELAAGSDVESALRMGRKAAAICVTRMGAASSIPSRNEVVSGS